MGTCRLTPASSMMSLMAGILLSHCIITVGLTCTCGTRKIEVEAPEGEKYISRWASRIYMQKLFYCSATGSASLGCREHRNNAVEQSETGGGRVHQILVLHRAPLKFYNPKSATVRSLKSKKKAFLQPTFYSPNPKTKWLAVLLLYVCIFIFLVNYPLL